MTRILISDAYAQEGLEKLEQAADVELVNRPGMGAEELLTVIDSFDALGVRSATKVTPEVIAASKGRLKAVVRAGVGVDNIDLAAAAEAGVAVMNTPFGNTVSAAEHAVALLLAVSRNIPQATASMKAGRWDKKRLAGRQLTGRCAGVIGFGNIGKVVVDRLVGLRLKVLVSDPIATAEDVAALGAELVEPGVLFAQADYVTLHVPLVPATKHLINDETLAQMKDDAFLICAARGGVVDEEALLRCLNAGRLSGAALDVFANEPVASDDPLVAHPKVICSPHLGASTKEAQLQVSIDAADQLLHFFRTGEAQNKVN
ncbi:MAG: hydroxyacid dehydrogenase [Myxococcota bacterium]|nr:hydroxyacid dehydrogenase [Myxococcota bacterium]